MKEPLRIIGPVEDWDGLKPPKGSFIKFRARAGAAPL